LQLRCSFEINVSDTSPPHCIIHMGLANKADHYCSIVMYLHSLLQSPLHLG
ncbi:hypothetical protein BT96DRAFT_794209, partial [Gymnopus androsaceus JB14]